jgi:hypothetical protein
MGGLSTTLKTWRLLPDERKFDVFGVLRMDESGYSLIAPNPFR